MNSLKYAVLALGLFQIANGVNAAETLPLANAMKMAVERSPRVLTAVEDLKLAFLEEPSLLALTDPTFGVRFSAEEDQGPRSAPAIQGAYTKTENLDFALTQNWLIGTEAQLFFTNQRVDSPTQFRPLNPTVDSRLGLEIRQPLLRNFWGRPDIAKRKQARAGVRAAENRVKRIAEETAAQAAFSYLNAWVAKESIQIRQAAVRDAERLLAKSQEKIRYGLVERSDLLQAQASLRVQQTELRLAQSNLLQAEHQLNTDLLQESVVSSYELSLPTIPARALPLLDDVLKVAFATRRDYLAAQDDVERAEWFLRSERLGTLPDLAAFGRYTSAGLGGNRSEARDNAYSFEDPIVMGGVELQIGLARSREKIRREEARRRLEMAKLRLSQIEQDIKKQVADALEKVAIAKERVSVYSELVDIERRKLAAEEENFQRGRSSTDLLIRFQGDIQRSETFMIQARADELGGWAQLLFVSGDFLERVGEFIGDPQ